jgi:hypothetical protein
MEELRVPRAEIEARILLEDGYEIAGRVFIPEVGPSGAARLVDRLSDPLEPFLPVSTPHGPLLVNILRILTVRVQDDPSDDDVSSLTVERIHLRLVGGATILGKIRYAMPPERSRLLDYLNAGSGFVKIETDHGTVLVQRRLITSIRRGD